MPRLIDADELITAFPCGESVRTESVRATIYHMPTVDAEPVRHGHWSERQSGELYNLPFSVVCCSVCGNPQSTETPYCPNCGAKMDEEEK